MGSINIEIAEKCYTITCGHFMPPERGPNSIMDDGGEANADDQVFVTGDGPEAYYISYQAFLTLYAAHAGVTQVQVDDQICALLLENELQDRAKNDYEW